jgi:hypothetical protein
LGVAWSYPLLWSLLFYTLLATGISLLGSANPPFLEAEAMPLREAISTWIFLEELPKELVKFESAVTEIGSRFPTIFGLSEAQLNHPCASETRVHCSSEMGRDRIPPTAVGGWFKSFLLPRN